MSAAPASDTPNSLASVSDPSNTPPQCSCCKRSSPDVKFSGKQLKRQRNRKSSKCVNCTYTSPPTRRTPTRPSPILIALLKGRLDELNSIRDSFPPPQRWATSAAISAANDAVSAANDAKTPTRIEITATAADKALSYAKSVISSIKDRLSSDRLLNRSIRSLSERRYGLCRWQKSAIDAVWEAATTAVDAALDAETPTQIAITYTAANKALSDAKSAISSAEDLFAEAHM